jgi:antitoxin MazE
MRSEIKRWGNSAAIRLPRGILAEARLDVSSPVTVVVEGGKIIIEATGEPLKKYLALPFSEADLVRGLNPETAHADELARPGGTEIGHR